MTNGGREVSGFREEVMEGIWHPPSFLWAAWGEPLPCGEDPHVVYGEGRGPLPVPSSLPLSDWEPLEAAPLPRSGLQMRLFQPASYAP